MKKIIILSLAIVLLFTGCTHKTKSILNGSYQSEKDGIGKVIQLSFQKDDNSFIEYIDNREVDKGTYEKTNTNVYKIKSDKQDFEITLSAKNSFEITINKLNDGKPIQLQNISDTPTFFSTKFDDIAEYKALLD